MSKQTSKTSFKENAMLNWKTVFFAAENFINLGICTEKYWKCCWDWRQINLVVYLCSSNGVTFHYRVPQFYCEAQGKTQGMLGKVTKRFLNFNFSRDLVTTKFGCLSTKPLLPGRLVTTDPLNYLLSVKILFIKHPFNMLNRT